MEIFDVEVISRIYIGGGIILSHAFGGEGTSALFRPFWDPDKGVQQLQLFQYINISALSLSQYVFVGPRQDCGVHVVHCLIWVSPHAPRSISPKVDELRLCL